MNLFLTMIICFGIFSSCHKNNELVNNENINEIEIEDSSLYRSWIFIYKEILEHSDTEFIKQPKYDTIPITISFVSEDSILGLHDQNTFNPKYIINGNQISFYNYNATDGTDTEFYWDYFIPTLFDTKTYTILDGDTLILSDQNDSISIYLTKYDNKNSTFLGYSVLYETSWKVEFIQIIYNSDYNKLTPPVNEEYPITLNINRPNNINGRFNVNVYNGLISIGNKNIAFQDINSTFISKSDWYREYINELKLVNSLLVSKDTLTLYDSNNNRRINYLSKEKFNLNYFNVDSLYDSK